MGRGCFRAALLVAMLALTAPAAASAAPANDDFVSAEPLSGDHVGVLGTTEGASFESGESLHGGSFGPSVWYSWTAARSGLIDVGCTSGFTTVIAVYRGSSLAGLTEVGTYRNDPQCPGFADFSFRAVGGVEYRIAVVAAGVGSGEFSLTLDNGSEPPPNDDFANSGTMQGLGGNAFAFGTTEGAGREPAEPAHGGSPTGASVWYTWTAQRNGPATLYFCNGSFHPLIDVYAGIALGGLTSLGAPSPGASLDPMCSLGGAGGTVFPALAGQTYAIAVDGRDGDWGSFELRLREAPPPRVPRPPDTLIYKTIKIRGASAKILFAARRGIKARYLCKLDHGPFRRCSSPKTYRGLSAGRHRFAVAAIALDKFGERDPTPAVRHFRIVDPETGK